jgi:2-polyprenyl-6-methoxyphenol 4-hydroxylase
MESDNNQLRHNSHLDQDNHYDIVIVGGGMVGISLALLLSQGHHWRILLVESKAVDVLSSSTASPSFDERSTALSWTSRQIYQSIGLWPAIANHAVAIENIHVSEQGHLGLTRISAAESGVEALGYVVENQRLGAVLLQHLANESVDIVDGSQVNSVTAVSNGMQLALNSPSAKSALQMPKVSTDLLVVADGADSKTAGMLGIHSHQSLYGQRAIISNVQLTEKHYGVAYERFTDHGPMALLPLSDFEGQSRSALVWVQPDADAEKLMRLSERQFLQALQQRFGYRLGRFSHAGERLSYPLALTVAAEQVRRNLVLVGNAAHSLHPVAGQGFNLSLRDVAALAENLNAGRLDGYATGSLAVLEKFYQRQYQDQRNTLLFSDNLTKFFGSSSAATMLMRNGGLLTLDLVSPLRQGFARFGMGMDRGVTSHG